MLLKALSDLFFIFFDRGHHVLELAANELNAKCKTLVEGRFVAERDGLFEQLEALGKEFLAAGTVEVIELLELGGFGLLDGGEGGPFEEKGGGQGPPEFLAAEV